jgi:hypothetical protein
MELLKLNSDTRSDRKWSWTKRNKSRANDILFVAKELRQWWPMTVRQIYYRLISSDKVQQDHWIWKSKHVDIYQALVRTLKWMRIDDMLSWGAITDEHRVTTPKVGFSDINQFIGQEMDDFLSGYARCSAQKQDYYIEIWVEKAALLHIIKPIVDNFCRRVVVCRGYNSVTFQSEFYDRAINAIGYDQKPLVLYFGDWDPSGVNMIYAAMQTIHDELGLNHVDYYRAGINPEHFNTIVADPVPIKPKDKRSKKFIQNHGTTAYELDAFHPEKLQRLVRESIMQFTDMHAFEENMFQETKDLDMISELKSDVVEFIVSKGME